MASWTDGAAYAPTERPDGFATPLVDPLPVAEAPTPITPGAIVPPRGYAASAEQPPLERIGGVVVANRDPRTPFATSSATLTAGPMGVTAGARDPHTPFPTRDSTALPPPSGDPLPPPTGAPLPGLPAPSPAGPWAPPAGHPSGPAPLLPAPAAKPNRTALLTGAGFLALATLVPSMAILISIATAILASNLKTVPQWLKTVATILPVTLFVAGLAIEDSNWLFRILTLALGAAFVVVAVSPRSTR